MIVNFIIFFSSKASVVLEEKALRRLKGDSANCEKLIRRRKII